MQTHTFVVQEEESGVRLDKFLSIRMGEISRSRLSQWVKDGFVTVDDAQKVSRYTVKAHEVVVLKQPNPRPIHVVGETLDLTIVYEDDALVVVDKPAGVVVHPGAGHDSGTLLNGLIGHFGSLSSVGAPSRPGVVHRIDAGTSGLLVFARTDAAHYHLADQFSKHEVDRIYLALVWDHGLDSQGTVETFYGRAPNHRIKFSSKVSRGKKAITHWETLGVYGPCRLLKLRLETGRTHQIRVHMADLNHPLLGDVLYGRRRRVEHQRELRQLGYEMGLSRQALHASVLGFQHPETGDFRRWTSSLPDDFRKVLEILGCSVDEILADL